MRTLMKDWLHIEKILAEAERWGMLADPADLHTLIAENFALAANQCDEGYGDEYGNHRCKRVDRAVQESVHLAGEANKLMAENARLREALRLATSALSPPSASEQQHGPNRPEAPYDPHDPRPLSHWGSMPKPPSTSKQSAPTVCLNAIASNEPCKSDDTLKRCTICGFIVDTKYKAEFEK